LKHVRKRLTYANVMSSIAVFLVLGGGAAVAAGLAKNSVGTPQIKRNAVKVGKLAPEAVKAGKLAKSAVPTNRLRDNAVSAEKIASGSVLTDKLADESVTSGKLAKDSVLTDKILNSAVTGEKLAAASVSAGKIANGAVGAAKLGAITVQTEKASVATGSNGSVNVNCPPGQRAISGGGSWGVFAAELFFLATRPIVSSANVAQMADGQVPGGWRASGRNTTGGPVDILVWVVCIA
jgi:hypothetical protein